MVLRFRCIRNILASWFSGSAKISGSKCMAKYQSKTAKKKTLLSPKTQI